MAPTTVLRKFSLPDQCMLSTGPSVLSCPPGVFQHFVVFYLCVIRHKPEHEATMASLCDQAQAAGLLVIDHYASPRSDYTETAPLVRAVLLRLKPDTGLRVTEAIVRISPGKMGEITGGFR